MSDEVRRLIYELVVEAKGVKEANDKTNAINDVMEKMTGVAKRAGAALAGAFAVKEIAKTLGDIQKMQAQLKTLGLTSSEATAGLKDIENVAVTTGSTIAEVSQVYGAAIEATQKLGGTQADAARLAEAFTRAAKAEGKSAADAARQLDTLQFAMDRGTVKAKELANIMKESETFQKAAEQAMGKTTAQIIKMAEAGELGAADLGKMVEAMKELGAQAEVPTTLEGITNSLVGMSQAFINAVASSSGLNDSLAHGVSGWQQFLDILRLVGTALGAVLRIAFNLVETLVQGAIAINTAFLRAIRGNFSGAAEAFDIYSQQVKENVADVEASIKQLGEAWSAATGEAPASAPGRQLGDPGELARQQREAMFDKAADDFWESFFKDAEKMKKAREKAAKEQAEINQRRLMQEAEDNVRAREFEMQQQKQLNDWLEAERVAAGERAGELIEESWQETSDEFDRIMRESEERAMAGAEVIGNAIGNAFAGASHNARDFFRDVLQGFAQLIASQAIQKFMKALAGDGAFGGFMDAILGAADGEAFNRGTVVPFAQGGVVSRPTGFAMSGGRMGLMGEAGAEAVMPLRRGADGKLGVAGTVPRVEIHNNLGIAANASVDQSGDRMRIVLEAAQLGANIAENRVNRSLRTGYGQTAQSVQRTYGLRRRF